MHREETEKKLRRVMVEDLRLEGIRPEDMDVNAPLFSPDGIGLDSLDAVELVMLIEKHFGLRIADANEARKVFTSIASVTDYIMAKQAG